MRDLLIAKLGLAYVLRDLTEVTRIGVALYDLGLINGQDGADDYQDSVLDDLLQEERDDLMAAF